MGIYYVGVGKEIEGRIGSRCKLWLPDRLLARALALVLQGSVLTRLGLRETNSRKRDQRRAFCGLGYFYLETSFNMIAID